MRIDYIEFKNFASYGNQMQRIEFEEDQSKLFLTLGKNGDGKTTIANAIIYALYGRIEGVKLSDLPNRINKELHVRIGLMCGTVQVEVERGLLPNKFSVKLNGVEFDKAGKKSVQDYLEEEVYGIPYHVFKNIIILSVNDFKSFLTMSNQDKKQIIDKMFGFSILNDMQTSIKTERKNIKMDIDLYESELTQILDSIASVKGKLNTLLEESHEKNNSKIDELKANLVELNESVKLLDIDKKSIDTEIDNKTEIFESTRSEASALKHEIEYLKRKVELYKSGKCPTCETQLDSQWHIDQKEHFCSKIEKDTEKIKTLKETLDTVKLNIDTLKEDKAAIEKKANDIRYNMKTFKSELLKIKEAPDDSQFTHLKNLIKDFELKEDTKSKSKDNLNADYAFMEIVEKVLGEDGVKNLAVKTILPGLNTNIAAMTQTMHLPFHIRFDEKFNCVINHLGEDINPMTLSTGERKKADFIIIIAIIKILKLRFPQLNLLFLDELLSSVDHDGVYNILKILNQVIKENKINTFVINHSVLPHEIFDKKLQIYRENGFSKFTIETID
jgi:DNA repair protein SbcC/Rad50